MNNYYLSSNQKKAIGLLSIGTFLEYFDLMLYVHIAIYINDLFFPATNPKTRSLITAFSFCSTFVFRPLGALIFGWIGDNMGRKASVIITTIMMSISCFIMYIIPTYAQIGIAASWILTICRIIQGISSMGEIIGAELYITEITKPPIQYPAVSIISIFATLGSTSAIGFTLFFTSWNLNWRNAFLWGAIISIIGFIARSVLDETPEFIHASKNDNKKTLKNDKRTSMFYFFIECTWPFTFYLIYFHCSHILKYTFYYTNKQIIIQNFIISIIDLLSFIFITYLSYRIHPLKILKAKSLMFIILTIIFPIFLNIATSPHLIFMLQIISIFFVSDSLPAGPIFYKHFPVFKRFTYASFIYALSRALIYVITSFGLMYLTQLFNNYGLYIIMIPVSFGLWYGVKHFQELENTRV